MSISNSSANISPAFATILAADLTSFVRDGRLFRVLAENDDDCRRDTVEEFINGKWVAIVIQSLDWQAELDRTLAAYRKAA